MANRGEMIPMQLTRNQAQYFSVLAAFMGDEASVIMCDEIVESGNPKGQITIKNKEEFDEYMSLVRHGLSEISNEGHDVVKIFRQMVAISRK